MSEESHPESLGRGERPEIRNPSKEEAEPRRGEARQEQHETQPASDIEAIQKRIEKEAQSRDEIKVEQGTKDEKHHVTINKQLKKEAYEKTLGRAQQDLSPIGRAFSKIVHQPIIDKASAVGAQTIARPFSLLSAGLFGLIGSSLILFAAKHYGFSYNPFVFLSLLLAGYVVGLMIEAIRFLIHPRRD